MIDKDWPALYADYLKSREWAARRAKVMARAGYRCEGCGDQAATEVHHLTYEHVTQEFLFELVALCEGCHERVHGVPKRPRAATWVPHRRDRPAVKETPTERAQRAALAMLAAEARAKFMAADLPKPPPPTAEQVAELAAAKREGRAPAEMRDVAEAS